MADITIAGEIFENVDFKDLETAQRLQDACDAASAVQKPQNNSRVQMIIWECEVAAALLNTMFGPDAAERVFRGRKNSGIAEAVMQDLIGAARQSDQSSIDFFESIQVLNEAAQENASGAPETPAAPAMNREQRRAEAQGKHKGKKGKKQRYQQPVLNLPMDEG